MIITCLHILFIVLVTAVLPPSPVTISQVRQLQQQYESLSTQAERTAFLRELARTAEREYRTGADPRQTMLRLAAGAMHREGMRNEAFRLYERIAARSSDPLDVASAHRMMAQILERWQRYEDALDHYLHSVSLLVGDADALARRPRELEWAVNGAAAMHTVLGDRASAVSVREILLREDIAPFLSEASRRQVLQRNARDALAAGDARLAISFWDRLFAENPGIGYEDGSRIDMVRQHARALRAAGRTQDYLTALWSIWNDPELAGFPEIARVGNELAAAYEQSGDTRTALDVSEEVVLRILDHEAAWMQSDARKTRRRLTTAINRTLLLAWDLQDYAMAYWAAFLQHDRLDPPEDPSGELLMRRFERLYQAQQQQNP